jgi:hypothetical protein
MIRNKISRCYAFIASSLIVLLIIFNLPTAHAQELTNRHILVLSAVPSAVTTHNFKFDIASASNLGSIVFEYCENSPVFSYTCDAPVGMDASSTNITAQSGNTGFSIDGVNTTSNKIVITRISAAASPGVSQYSFGNITNPSNAPHVVFVRISTFASVDGSGASTDVGAVAFAINSPLNVDAYIPPFLTFCTGVTVATNCSSTNGDSIDMGILSTSHSNSTSSQFSTATNDPSGYVVYVLGNTMTSGNNIIPALPAPVPSVAGSSQFGINLRGNTSPAVGQDRVGAGTGLPTINYSFPNFFAFVDGDAIASSVLSSDYTRMTVSYLVNASGSQAPGIYSTTLTYMATVQF